MPHNFNYTLTSHGKSNPSPSMTSVSCGPRTIVGGAKTLSIAGGASLLPAILWAEHSYLPASDACTSDIIRLPESTIDNLFERNEKCPDVFIYGPHLNHLTSKICIIAHWNTLNIIRKRLLLQLQADKSRNFDFWYGFTHRFPLRSNSFPFMYQSTDGSGIPRGGVQLSTTGPPTKATVSLGTSRKSSRKTARKKGTKNKLSISLCGFFANVHTIAIMIFGRHRTNKCGVIQL